MHNVYVDNRPARVYTPQYTIPDTYNVFKEKISRDGGVPVGLDHLPEHILKEYPVLGKLNPLHVADITKVGYTDDSIYGLEIEYKNDLIKDLYRKGELESFSIVADFNAGVCESGKADYVMENITNLNRVDFVDEGGCSDCKVGAPTPDNVKITARLSLLGRTKTEDNNMDDENKDEIKKLDIDSDDLGEQETEQEMEQETEQLIDSDDSEEQETGQEKADPLELLTEKIQDLEKSIGIIAEKTAAIDEVKIEARKGRITRIVETAITEGKALPKEKEHLISYGETDETALKEMLASRPVLVDFEKHSKHVDAKEAKKDYTYETYKKRRKRGYKIAM